MRLRSRVVDAVYLRQHIVQLGFRLLKIVFRLHIHPQLRAIAKQCAQAQRHFRGDPATLGQKTGVRPQLTSASTACRKIWNLMMRRRK